VVRTPGRIQAKQLAGDGVFGPPRDRDEALRVLRAGVDHLDTAQFYGVGGRPAAL
jgi:pyridoxine 4-dehydrogenase